LNKQKWYILTTVVYPAQGVQKGDHPRVFTKTKC